MGGLDDRQLTLAPICAVSPVISSSSSPVIKSSSPGGIDAVTIPVFVLTCVLTCTVTCTYHDLHPHPYAGSS